MREFLFLMAGLFLGALTGVTAMCLLQISHCHRCPYKQQ